MRLLSPFGSLYPRTCDLCTLIKNKPKTKTPSQPQGMVTHCFGESYFILLQQGLYTFTMGLFSSRGSFPFPTTCTITGG